MATWRIYLMGVSEQKIERLGLLYLAPEIVV